MKTIGLTALLVSLVAAPAMAQGPDSFAACAAGTGEAYQAARARFLAGPGDAAFLKQKLRSDAWRERLAARILRGWIERKDAYRDLLAGPKISNQAGDEHYAWAVSRDGIQAGDVPLMYELLMKGTDADAAWDAARATVALVGRKAVPVDIRLLHQFLQDPAAGNAAARAPVAWLIGALPANYQAAAELQASLKAEMARKDRDRAVTLSLLEGLGRAAKSQSAKVKNELAQAILSTEDLPGLVGALPVTYAIGNIGGDRASEAVVQYLARTDDEVEKLWALGALSRSDSPVATQALLRYADSGALALRTEAIRGLGRAHYLPAVAAKLEAIALHKKTPTAQQVLAVRSLAQIGTTHAADTNLHKQIQNQIQTISANSANAELRKELKSLLQGLQPR